MRTTQKPFQLYEFIEKCFPGGPFIEIFARRHNAREGWLSIGNEAIDYHPELFKTKSKKVNQQVQAEFSA
jgi:N6-adenosine-specific RNA methylase IME4